VSTYTLAPYETRQYSDDNGVPLNGGLVYTYASGTSTPAITYSNSTGTPNANPIVLDAAGRCIIYLPPSSFKFIIRNAAGVQVGTTIDPVAATASGAGVTGLGEIFVLGSNSSSPVTATSYPSGATFDMLQPGSSVWSIDSANLSGTYVLEVTGVQDTSGTLTVALVNLSDGAPDTPLVTCAITSLTGQVVQSSGITFAASGAAKSYGIKAKVSANTGFVIGARITRTA
jgi:hypothetical protein